MTDNPLDPASAVSAETLRDRATALIQRFPIGRAHKLVDALDAYIDACKIVTELLQQLTLTEDAVARARVEARAEWQPIASAPTGKPVLVYLNGTANLGIYRAILAQWYKDEMPQWRPVGYTRLDEFATDACITHWMPLPDPPVAGHA